MKVVVSGGTGFVGEPLVRRLLARGEDVAVLSRNPSKVRAGRGLSWHATDAIAAADVVINLAGENIGSRWSAERKRRILDSRVTATSKLVEAMRMQPQKARTFLSASAVGFYGPRGDETIDESGASGGGFLAEVTRKWEELAHGADGMARVVITRFGVVLAKDGGALQKLLLPFRLGAGGPVGGGKQWMSWVDREDAIRFIEWAIDHEGARGAYNVTAPEPVTSREFARALGRALHRPAILPAPAFALRMLFGQMADETLLSGQRVVPARAMREGFAFRYPSLDASLEHAIGTG